MIRKPNQHSTVNVTPGQVHFLANRLRRYFAPASIMPVPGAKRDLTGNRNTAATAHSAANTTATDSAVLQFKAGVALWKFKTIFKTPPHAIAIGITTNTGGPQEIVAQGLGTTESMIFNSSDAGDNRLVFVHAIEGAK